MVRVRELKYSLRQPGPPLAVMSVERAALTSDATYKPVSQETEGEQHASRVAYGDEEEGPDDEERAALPTATTNSIRRIHFMLGAALLLPWNCTSRRTARARATD